MTKKTIDILHLYPKEMNIYGDWGNVLTLKKRLEWRGYNANTIEYCVGDKFPSSVDIVVGGGGQDSGQLKIRDDLQKIAPNLRELAESGTPILVVCGLYQLFGHSFTTKDGEMIPGIGIFDAKTIGGDERIVGNITLKNEKFGEIIGYENHSGLTYLAEGVQPFGDVLKGVGNNSSSDNEGAIYKSTIGTYLHGSLLPKNPKVADWLLGQAVHKKYGEKLAPINKDYDKYVDRARAIASQRPR